jgi:hypothetical protein
MKHAPNLITFLAQTTQEGLGSADETVVIAIATTLWYSDAIPDLAALPADRPAEAGYLVGRLLRLGPFTRSRKENLHKAFAPFQATSPSMAPPDTDALVAIWGVAPADMDWLIQAVLAFWTRHFATIVTDR